MATTNIDEWYRPRHYAHLDWPLSKLKAGELVKDPKRVAQHAFLPFLNFDISEKRYKAAEKKVVLKSRPICFAAHSDSHIFSYYAWVLKTKLEDSIVRAGVNDAVLAYRRFPGGKCNIHFANDAFNEVSDRGACVAIAMDVEKFFDSFDHKILKQAWCELIGSTDLPSDHYAVFRAITRFATIDQANLFEEFGLGRRAQEKLSRPLCSPKEFRERVRGNGLISRNDTRIGIPQGSPISAVLSNLYMLQADKKIHEFALKSGGVYRRYSDDILLICDADKVKEFEAFVTAQLKALMLQINDEKTQRSKFTVARNQICDRPLQYLGFEFDGQRKMVRSKTIARFKRRMKQAIKSAGRAARKNALSGAPPRIRRRKLFDRFSHLGRKNFISYAFRSASIMNDKTPRRQMRNHWRHLNQAIRKREQQE